MDGRPMGIPASQPEVGCRQLWLTPAVSVFVRCVPFEFGFLLNQSCEPVFQLLIKAFQAMGATAEEMASGKLILQWGYSK